MTEPSHDLVVVGDCGVDLYVRVPHPPGHDEKVPGDLIGAYGGGVAANFACAAGRLGARVSLVATVGDDQFGDVAVDSVAAFGVATDAVVRRAGETTSFCVVALDASGEKALTIVRTPTFFPTLEYVSRDRVRDARVVHLAPFDLEVATELARTARAAGALVTVDLEPAMVGDDLARVAPLLREVDLVLPNRLCLARLFPGLPVEAAAARLRTLGPAAVVVTQGEHGAVVQDGDTVEHVAAVPADVVDTTGAGDAFNAALVTAWSDGASLVDAARRAVHAASFSIGAVGARTRLATAAELAGLVDARADRGTS